VVESVSVVVSTPIVVPVREVPVASTSYPTPRVSSDGGAPPPLSYLRITDNKSKKYVDYAWPAIKNAVNILPGIDRTMYIYDDEDFPRYHDVASDKVIRLPKGCSFPYTVENFIDSAYDKEPNFRHTFLPPK